MTDDDRKLPALCPECEGAGEMVACSVADYIGEPLEWVTCPTCQGAKTVPAQEESAG